MSQFAAIHTRYRRLLKNAGWFADATGMFKQPSVAKDSPGREACEDLASSGQDMRLIMDDFLLAARLEHLIAIGGAKARRFLFSAKCPLNAPQIAKLCRRMPPFIEAKLEDLYAGGANIDSNPTGAFDTNGWAELRVRLPKFAHALARYATANGKIDLPTEKAAKLGRLAAEIVQECDQMLDLLQGRYGNRSPIHPKLEKHLEAIDWSKAVVRFAQALGVLRKTNRDLRSPHWRADWVPTAEDLRIVARSIHAMKSAAEGLLKLQVG